MNPYTVLSLTHFLESVVRIMLQPSAYIIDKVIYVDFITKLYSTVCFIQLTIYNQLDNMKYHLSKLHIMAPLSS